MADPWDKVPVVSRARGAKKATGQDPWSDVPVVDGEVMDEAPSADEAAAYTIPTGQRLGDDGKPYSVANRSDTTETPEELTAQGYRQDSNGTWFKMVADPAIAGREAEKPRLQQQIGSFAQSATEVLALDDLAAWTAGKLYGRPYQDVRQAGDALASYDKQYSGGSRLAGQVAAVGASLAAPGAGYIRGATGLGAVSRAGQVGAGYGALYGLGSGEGSLADRVPNALMGAAGGAVLGGAVQSALPTVERAAQSIGQRIAGISVGGRGGPRNAEQRAATRLAESFAPGALSERQRLTELGLEPSIADIGGGTTERLVRTAAAPMGPGAEAAVGNAGARQANLRPEVMARTREILPDQRSATAIRDGLEESRDALAATEYAPAYEAPVTLTPDAARALRGADGEAAIRRAMLGARANGDTEALAEMQSLLTADLDQLPTVSGRTLDRVRIAMRDISQNFMRGERPDRVRSAGYASRVAGIDDALDGAPGLVEARTAFRERSGAIDAIDNRPDVYSTDPRDFASWVRDLTPEQRQAAIAGVRQDVLDTLGSQRNAGTGTLDTLTQSQYAQRNLASLLGEEEAARYLGSVAARVQQTQRAQRISPNTGSQTFLRGIDDASTLADRAAAGMDAFRGVRGDVPALARTIDRIRARVTMSPEDREAIVRLGLGSARELERIVMLADEARTLGRRPPREVLRFVTNAETKLGGSVGSAIRDALLPPPAGAEEQEAQ